ncbi:MAG: divergent PAP2 family protein [Oscillospiraceae bacterium]|nr:divergent PAP2 family protein [Oscillospiraceae bacterium]
MSFFSTITSNPLINIAFVAWASAQLIKTLLTFILTKKFDPERLFGAGGMPSSHSSLVCSLTVGMARSQGFASPIFALCVALAAIVMYDAMGVRREAGKHAKVLNRMQFDFNDLSRDLAHLFATLSGKSDLLKDKESAEILEEIKEEGEEDNDPARLLKEFLGHTPLEVLGGALLGVLIGTVWPIA